MFISPTAVKSHFIYIPPNQYVKNKVSLSTQIAEANTTEKEKML